MSNIITILCKGIITGILSGYLLMYGLRPAIPYPEFILEPIEHKWLFIILFIINYYMFLWDTTVAILMLLSIIALIFDMLVFTGNGFQKINTVIKKYDINFFNIEPSYISNDKDKDENDDKNNTNSYINEKNYYTTIIDELKNIKNTQENITFNPGDPSPFIL